MNGGIEANGWKLVYNDEPNLVIKTYESNENDVSLTYSLGLSLEGSGEVSEVLWDSPAFNAGIINGNSIVAVNGRAFSADVIKDAIKAAKGTAAPIELLVKRGDRYETVRIDYHGGLLYPHLERIAGKPDRLGELFKAR